uniref:Ig-like domain-containing protein n=1 Tax=Oncorhynchus mykiss TaxID=8022 RepID=A0A8C7SM46_ONCMY
MGLFTSLGVLCFLLSTGAYRVSVKTGGSITIPCRYDLRYKTHVKYLCEVDYFQRCFPDVHSKSINKASISHYINKQTFTVTMTDLRTEDSGSYRCAVEINGGSDVIIKRFHLSVTPGKMSATLPYDYMTGVLDVTGVEGGSVIVNCYYSDTVNIKWCRIGVSVSCMDGNSGTISETSVTLQQTTDAPRRNVLTVTMSGLKTENTGWYRCGVGDLIMPVHITVRQQTTTMTSEWKKCYLSRIPN